MNKIIFKYGKDIELDFDDLLKRILEEKIFIKNIEEIKKNQNRFIFVKFIIKHITIIFHVKKIYVNYAYQKRNI